MGEGEKKDDKAPPRGALEEAVSLFDELWMLWQRSANRILDEKFTAEIGAIQRRRLALEPRLAKLRANQAKVRP